MFNHKIISIVYHPMPYNRKFYLSLCILIFILIANGFFLNFNAFRCFNFLDMGSFLDASWRVLCGQKPYKDFICHTGPVHFYMNAFFLKLLGLGKNALLAHLITAHSIVIILVFLMLYPRVPLYITLAGTLLTVPSFYWSVSHPMHDQSAHLWGIMALTVIVTHMPLQKKIYFVAFLSGLLAMISIATKINIGLAYWSMFLFSFLFSNQRKKALCGFATGTLLGLGAAWALILYPIEYFQQLMAFSHTAEAHKRLSQFLYPSEWFVNYYWLPFFVILINKLLSRRECRQFFVLFTGLTLVGIFTVNTGGLIKPANNFLWGVHMSLAFILLYYLKGTFLRRGKIIFNISLSLLIVLTLFLFILSVRNGLGLKAWTYNTANPVGDYPLQIKPMQGWLTHKPQGQPLEVLVDFINSYAGKEDSLLNLTDMYIIYALTGHESYPHIPIAFLNGALPAPGQQTEEVKTYILENPPQWIIAHRASELDEFVFLDLKDFIQKEYKTVARVGFYYMLKRKVAK